jgi:deoxyadenosine/deoxycytidine kinase
MRWITAIEGNIASGKSTQVKLFNGIVEPVQDWPLDLFYSDQKRWSLLMQLSVLKTFSGTQYNQSNLITERSPDSALNVFWNLVDKTKEEDSIYRYFDGLVGWNPDKVVYIRTPPNTCFERLVKRKNIGDSKVTLEYIKKIHDKYDTYISSLKCPKITIDGTLPQDQIQMLIREFI